MVEKKQWGGSPDDFLEYSIVKLASQLEARFRNALKPVGFTPHGFSALACIEASPGLIPAELARLILITPQSMGPVLDQLENAGYIKRKGVRKRGVPSNLGLTAAGRKALGSAWTIVAHLDRQTRAELGPDYQTALSIIHRWEAALELNFSK